MPSKHARHGSHIPILRVINQIFSVKTVIELGSGIFSTGTFLDRKYFPDLVSLNSYESSERWFKLIDKKFGTDRRLKMFKVDQSHEGISHLKKTVDSVDLMFIDSSDEQRRYAMSDLFHIANILIMHDAHVYQEKKGVIVPDFSYRFEFFPPYKKKDNSTLAISNSIDVKLLENIVVWENDFEKWTI